MRALCAAIVLVLVAVAWPLRAEFGPGGEPALLTGTAGASQLEAEAEAAPAPGPSAQPPTQPATQPPTQAEPRPCKAVAVRPVTPLRVFAAIEDAWNDGQPDSIVRFLPEDKILLRLEKSAPEKAFYSNKQAAYMLRDEFRFTMTESFEFVDFTYSKDGDDPPSARAQWAFRREPEGQVTVQKVRIGLRLEADRWVVSEIKIED